MPGLGLDLGQGQHWPGLGQARSGLDLGLDQAWPGQARPGLDQARPGLGLGLGNYLGH